MLALFAVLMVIIAIQFRDTYFFGHKYILTYLAKNAMLFGVLELL